MRTTAVFVFASFLGGCALFPWMRHEDTGPFVAAPARTVSIVNESGAAIGQATLAQESRAGVMIRLEFAADALPPGWHGVHLHERGDCSDANMGFHASGSHVGHGDRIQHGLLNQMGPEAGDLPQVFAVAGQPFAAEFFATGVTLASVAPEGRMALLDADGSAIIIHAGRDDHLTQPIGGAGVRIACAAITP